MQENEKDCAQGLRTETISAHWPEICEIIDSVPTCDRLMEKYEKLGVKSTLADISVPEPYLDALLEYAPLVRNRLTLMRLRRAMQ